MASSRKSGKLAALYLHVSATPALASAVKVADTYDWRFEPTVDLEDCTVKGEGFKRSMPGSAGARLTCQAHFNTLAQLVTTVDDAAATVAFGGGMPSLIRCAFKLITINTSAPGVSTITPAGQQKIEGFGWVSRGALQGAHDQLIVDDFEIQVDGEWAHNTT